MSERIYSSLHHTTTPTHLSFSTYHNISKYKKITIYLCVYILIFCSPPIHILHTTKKYTFFSRLPLILNITSISSPPYVIQKKHAVISISLLPSYPFVYLPCFRMLRSVLFSHVVLLPVVPSLLFFLMSGLLFVVV